MHNWARIPKKIAYRLKIASNDAFFALGWRKTRGILSLPGQRILVYHGLDERGEKSLNGRFLSASRFEAQVRFLSENAQLISLDDYFAGSFDPQRFAVALTFDDGYRNNLTYALPVLEKYGVPATFFLTSASGRGAEWLWMDFLDVATRLAPDTLTVGDRRFVKKRWQHTRYFADEQGRKLVDRARYAPWSFIQAMEAALQAAGAWNGAADWATYWQLLSPPEIRELASHPLATIGAHGHTHQDLAHLPPEAAIHELRQCKEILENITGSPVRALAYPFGTYTRALVDAAAQMGFSQQLAVDFLFPEDPSDPRLRSRTCINPFVSEENQWLAIRNGRF